LPSLYISGVSHATKVNIEFTAVRQEAGYFVPASPISIPSDAEQLHTGRERHDCASVAHSLDILHHVSRYGQHHRLTWDGIGGGSSSVGLFDVPIPTGAVNSRPELTLDKWRKCVLALSIS
jgi:hypothetical protein